MRDFPDNEIAGLFGLRPFPFDEVFYNNSSNIIAQYDAYVFCGDSITNMSAQNKEEQCKIAFVKSGFPDTVEVYASGLSGHTTKTFTEKFIGQVTPSTSRTLSEYETLLSGKRVLFIDVLRTNDWKEICRNGKDFDEQKAECEQWTATLAGAIANSSLDADYAIASQPFGDWRNINVRGNEGFDIIDGLAPDFDQTVRWQTEVVEALCQLHSPKWFTNGKCYFDLFAITRNYFRFWFGNDDDSIHPHVYTSDIYRNYFAERAYNASLQGLASIPSTSLYPYSQSTDFSIGESIIFDFGREYDTPIAEQDGWLKDTNINIVSIGKLRETTLKKTNGSLVHGRSYLVTSGDNGRVTSGSGNPGDTSTSLTNHYLLKSCQYVSPGETMDIVLSGLPTNTEFNLSISASYNSSSATCKITSGLTEITLDGTKIINNVVPTASGLVQSSSNGELLLTLQSKDNLGVGAIGGMQLTRTN